MKLRRYDAGELTRFLTALDQQLGHRAVIVLIGGSALALGHGVPAVTNDIDTYESSAHKLAAAAARARTHVGLAIPLGDSSIAQLPPGYQDRAFRALPTLRFLEVWVAEAHDLAASKLLRGDEHDRQQLRMLHDVAPLDLATLRDRFSELLSIFIGDPREPRWSLHHFVEEVWGEIAALDVRPE